MLRLHGHRVVAIEHDRGSAAIPVARSLGVPVVVGDGGRPTRSSGPGSREAANLIWSIGDFVEGRTVVTSAAEALRGQRPRNRRDDWPASCRLRVRDLGLCELLRRDVLVGHGLGSQEPDVDFFNEWENTAQRLLWNVMRGYALSGDDVDIWIVGGGPLAEALALQAVRNWWGLPVSRRRTLLSIHFFDDDASGSVIASPRSGPKRRPAARSPRTTGRPSSRRCTGALPAPAVPTPRSCSSTGATATSSSGSGSARPGAASASPSR